MIFEKTEENKLIVRNQSNDFPQATILDSSTFTTCRINITKLTKIDGGTWICQLKTSNEIFKQEILLQIINGTIEPPQQIGSDEKNEASVEVTTHIENVDSTEENFTHSPEARNISEFDTPQVVLPQSYIIPSVISVSVIAILLGTTSFMLVAKMKLKKASAKSAIKFSSKEMNLIFGKNPIPLTLPQPITDYNIGNGNVDAILQSSEWIPTPRSSIQE